MTTLERLRTADPARDLDPTPPEDLLRAIVATPAAPATSPPRGARARPRDRGRAGGALPAPRRLDGPRRPRLRADRPASRLDPLRPHDHAAADGARRAHRARRDLRRERWQQGGRWRSVLHHQGEVFVEVRDADGTPAPARRRDRPPRGRRRRPGLHRPQRARLPGHVPHGLRERQLDESGDATLRRPAPRKRYVVVDKHGGRAEYFLDAETGMPLGSRQKLVTYSVEIGPDRRPAPGGRRTATCS